MGEYEVKELHMRWPLASTSSSTIHKCSEFLFGIDCQVNAGPMAAGYNGIESFCLLKRLSELWTNVWCRNEVKSGRMADVYVLHTQQMSPHPASL